MSRPEAPSNLFVAFTPYHAFLASGLALGSPSARNHLILVADFVGADRLASVIEAQDPKLFDSVTVLPGFWVHSGPWSRQLVKKRNSRRIREWVRRHRPDSIHGFVDSRPEVQVAFDEGRRRKPAARTIHVEDGSVVYGSFTDPVRSPLKTLLNRLVHGPAWREVRVAGTLPGVDELRVLFPEAIRPELGERPVNRLPPESFRDPRMHRLAKDVWEEFAGKQPLRPFELVMAVAHSDRRRAPGYGRAVERIFDHARDQGILTAIKLHPRERELELPGIRRGFEPVLIPQAIPLEFCFLLFPELKYVVGDTTGALLTARWLLPRAVVISVGPILGGRDQTLLRSMEKVGVRLIRDSEEIRL